MNCPSCASPNDDASQFCSKCGASLSAAASSVPTRGGLPGYPTAGLGESLPPYQATSFAEPTNYLGPMSAFGAPLASWWQRVGSLLLDILILVIPYAIISFIVQAATSTTVDGVRIRNGTATDFLYVAFLVVQAIYFTRLNGLGAGQTLGNRAPGIAVRDMNTGAAIGASRGFVRWLVRGLLYVVVIPGIVNDLFPLWDPRRQTIADKVAKSVMIRVG